MEERVGRSPVGAPQLTFIWPAAAMVSFGCLITVRQEQTSGAIKMVRGRTYRHQLATTRRVGILSRQTLQIRATFILWLMAEAWVIRPTMPRRV